MVKRNTWILLGFFAALLIVVWAIPRWQAKNPAPTPTSIPSLSSLFGTSNGTIKEMKIAGSDGEGINIVSTGNGQWSATAQPDPKNLAVDQLQQAITTMQGLSITTILATPPPMDAIGLTNPSYTLTIMMDKGPQHVVKVGSVTPTGSGYYIQMDSNSPTVVDKSSLDGVLNLLSAPGVATQTPGTGGTTSPAGTPSLSPTQTHEVPTATP